MLMLFGGLDIIPSHLNQMSREDHCLSPVHLFLPWSRNWPRSTDTGGTEDTVTAAFQVTPLQLWRTSSHPGCPLCPQGIRPRNTQWGKSVDNPIQIHDEPPSLAEGGSLNFENGVETEVSSFSFQLKTPKGVRPTVHDELILRGLGSPLAECRNAANELLLMKQSHRSYTKNQLKRRENKFIDIFRHGKNFPTPQDLEKDLFSPYKPLRDAARIIFMRKNLSDTAATVQIYNKGLIDLYKKEQIKKNLQQMNLERKEDQKSLKKRGPQITNAVSWDPELWKAVDCEDPYVKCGQTNTTKC